jgi:hypothetical protein
LESKVTRETLPLVPPDKCNFLLFSMQLSMCSFKQKSYFPSRSRKFKKLPSSTVWSSRVYAASFSDLLYASPLFPRTPLQNLPSLSYLLSVWRHLTATKQTADISTGRFPEVSFSTVSVCAASLMLLCALVYMPPI